MIVSRGTTRSIMISPPYQARQQDFDFLYHVAASCLVGSLWQTKVRRWVLQPCCQIESPLVLQATALDCELVPISPLAGSNNWYRLSSLMLSWYKIGGAKAWQWGPTKCHRLERAERHGFTSPDIVTFETPTTSFNRFHWSTLLFRVLFLLTVACP